VHAVKRQQHISKSRQLQRVLYRAAKRSRSRRFHALYDRMWRPDVLQRAWEEVRSNRGECGIDGMSIGAVEASGVAAFLDGIAEDLKSNRYHPKPVRRVYIPKSDGQKRPLGIPTVRDRVVQQACKIVIEPIFEATFEDCSYGFRPKRSAQQAVDKVKKALILGWQVLDADIQGFFDNVNHDVALGLVGKRVSDKRVLKLIRQWLKGGVIGEDGQYQATEKGTPQGGVISPLLANIYLHVLDRFWVTTCAHLGTLVRYCDDFVIVCREAMQAKQALREVRNLLTRLKLTLHPEKTKIVRPVGAGFDFLGFCFQKFKAKKTGKLFPHNRPSKKAMNSVREKIREKVNAHRLKDGLPKIVADVNKSIVGWRNYFSAGNATRQLQYLDHYVYKRFEGIFKRKYNKSEKRAKEKLTGWYSVSNIAPFYKQGICGRA
jgi:RNA-directed DNA polymerase